MKLLCLLIAFVFGFAILTNAQYTSPSYTPNNVTIPNKPFSVGLGFGLEYGGFGANFLYYPDTHFGLFGGLGYAFAGVGYNIGVKLMMCRDQPRHRTLGFAELMFGYNAAVTVKDYAKFDKLFYGISPGIGIDIHTKRDSFRYWSLAFIFPIRPGTFDNYMDELKSKYHIEFEYEPTPVLFSVGFHM